MASVSRKQCDVFGSYRRVKTVTVKVLDELGNELQSVQVDLCPRGQRRLSHFIRRATTAPKYTRRSIEPASKDKE